MRNFKTTRNLIVIAAVLCGTGYFRMPKEQKFMEDLRERKIAHPQIDSEIWSKMGQTSLAGTFGGLRSVMASFMSIGAYDHFENNDWYKLEKDFEVITALDPYNAYYWNIGAWHLGWNAASWARRNQSFSPAKQRLFEMEFLEKGDAMYREGLKYNPLGSYNQNQSQLGQKASENLWFDRGAMWSNEFKRPDLERAAEAFRKLRNSPNLVHRRRYLLTIARIPGREIEAYKEMVRLLKDSDPRGGCVHTIIPTFRVLMLILGSNPELTDNSEFLAGVIRPRIDQVFPTDELAYRDLYNYWVRIKNDGYYAGNYEVLMKQLIDKLKVPDSLNPYVTEPKRPLYPSVWKRELEKRDRDGLSR
jgi:hypothetical protein